MGWMKFAMVLGLLWGTAAFATLPDAIGGERQELQSISSWISYLNVQYDDEACVATAEDLSDPTIREEVKKELYLLESVFRGEDQLPARSLMLITCESAVCGGSGDPGGCMTCNTLGDNKAIP